MSEQQASLVENNVKLVYYLVRKSFLENGDYDELISTGFIGLVKAAKTFDEDKQIKFATYASKCIVNEILMFLRKRDRLRKNGIICLSMEANFQVSEEKANHRHSPLNFQTLLADDTDIEAEYIERTSLQQALESLNARDRELLEMNYMRNMGQREIASYYGISQSYVSRKLVRAIKELKRSLNKQ